MDEGRTNREIAHIMKVSLGTVGRKRVMLYPRPEGRGKPSTRDFIDEGIQRGRGPRLSGGRRSAISSTPNLKENPVEVATETTSVLSWLVLASPEARL